MNKKKPLPERRKHFRYKIECVAFCRRLDNDLRKGVTTTVQIKNVSVGGALFEARESFLLGSRVALEIIPEGWERFRARFYKPRDDISAKRLCVHAQVVRVDEISRYRSRVGVLFISISSRDKHALEAYANQKWGKRKKDK